MKKIILFISFIAVMVMLAACGGTDINEKQASSKNAEKWNEIQEKGTIVAGTSGTLIAASTYDDNEELTGYDVEIMREVANRLGLDIKFEILGIDSMLPAIESGRIDVAVNDIEITDNRKEQFAFSEPYKYSYTTMVVREADNSGIKSLEDLEGKRAGGGATTIFSQIAEHFGAEVVTYGNAPNEAYLRDVHNGNTDVIVNDYYLSKFGVGAFPEFDIHLHPDLKFHPTEQAVVMDKDAETLQQKINETLSEMREDGTLSELAVKFYQEDASQKPEGEIEEIEGARLIRCDHKWEIFLM
ncbi:amino acid ABC transporter substrate-binding protein [Gracilibacillus boraciitolerans JCM 21714]|uniref:Amino acid ABC transporter substrate-binding protein n=1 Tax=Gracilibacillus boraciitolerans JCM 21714 TaxID=1298598 RepID=W4VM16_9BACI|nr:transporter substrate-binding domain-containing protein [Gracilibacillus boraciitolerans]GAE94405.1 amino acid ABC transporter substrate-binding protein [Gracilibacillus boraciitolerans JCM 21714]